MPIYFIQYKARPNLGSEDFVKYGGGFINCWVKSNSPDEARKAATKNIHASNWEIMAAEEDCREVTERPYPEDDNLEYYEQAMLDGECYVFHTWGNEPQQDNERH